MGVGEGGVFNPSSPSPSPKSSRKAKRTKEPTGMALNSMIANVMKRVSDLEKELIKAFEVTGKVQGEAIPIRTISVNGLRYGLFIQVIVGNRGTVRRVILGKQKGGRYFGKTVLPIVDSEDLYRWGEALVYIAEKWDAVEAIISAVRGETIKRGVRVTEERDIL